MTLTFFDQFSTPWFMGLPLVALALVSPYILYSIAPPHLLFNRLIKVQIWTTNLVTKQLMQPLSLKAHKWALTLISLIIFLAVLNMTGLFPYTFTPTTQPQLNMTIALPFWLTALALGLFSQPSNTLGHLLPEGTPTFLIPVLILIETISLLIRPLALGVRLTANLTAGHLLIHLVATAIFVILPLMPLVAILTVLLMYFLTFLEIAVGMIQAYVFVLLVSLYMQENT